jgi:hypothetical protein
MQPIGNDLPLRANVDERLHFALLHVLPVVPNGKQQRRGVRCIGQVQLEKSNEGHTIILGEDIRFFFVPVDLN